MLDSHFRVRRHLGPAAEPTGLWDPGTWPVRLISQLVTYGIGGSYELSDPRRQLIDSAAIILVYIRPGAALLIVGQNISHGTAA